MADIPKSFEDIVAFILADIRDDHLFPNKPADEIVWNRDLDLTEHFDSVSSVELVMQTEDRFGISIPMNEVAEIKTLGEFADAVLKLTAAKAAA